MTLLRSAARVPQKRFTGSEAANECREAFATFSHECFKTLDPFGAHEGFDGQVEVPQTLEHFVTGLNRRILKPLRKTVERDENTQDVC